MNVIYQIQISFFKVIRIISEYCVLCMFLHKYHKKTKYEPNWYKSVQEVLIVKETFLFITRPISPRSRTSLEKTKMEADGLT